MSRMQSVWCVFWAHTPRVSGVMSHRAERVDEAQNLTLKHTDLLCVQVTQTLKSLRKGTPPPPRFYNFICFHLVVI